MLKCNYKRMRLCHIHFKERGEVQLALAENSAACSNVTSSRPSRRSIHILIASPVAPQGNIGQVHFSEKRGTVTIQPPISKIA
jgi:hypothetical protein